MCARLQMLHLLYTAVVTVVKWISLKWSYWLNNSRLFYLFYLVIWSVALLMIDLICGIGEDVIFEFFSVIIAALQSTIIALYWSLKGQAFCVFVLYFSTWPTVTAKVKLLEMGVWDRFSNHVRRLCSLH